MPLGFTLYNRSNETVLCSISNKTNPSGNSGWFELRPGANETWARSGWEDVSFKSQDNSKQKALWINRGSPAVVSFNGFDRDFTIQNDYKPEEFIVNNCSDKAVSCFISTTSGGNGAWFKLAPGEKETWKRKGWETIAFKNEDDTERKGVYATNCGSRATIGFHGFEKDIVVHPPPANFILDEHYAEAMAIADRSFNAQSSRASNPGGLTASIYKAETLELYTTGRKQTLSDHTQIYTLALLINHLKYGLTEPAIVVSVTPEWVKVAAYTAEFDAIVVLGFPTKAADLVAPGKQRPAVGTRLIVVSQFGRRDEYRQGVLGDITPGRRSRNVWYNVHPLVAQYVTDDSLAPIWEQHLAKVDENLWGELWEGWLAWKQRHGADYFRLGAPSQVQLISTNRANVKLPEAFPDIN